MMKNMNIALLTDVPPDDKYTAGQVLNGIISKLPKYNFNLHWLNQSNLDDNLHLPDNCKVVHQYSLRRDGFLLFCSRVVNYFGRRWPKASPLLVLPRITIYLISFFLFTMSLAIRMRKEKAGTVWLVVQGDKLVLCYWLAMLISRKPYILHQWDPLSWWMGHRQYPKWSQKIVGSMLSRLESRARLNIVPSDAWRDLLTSQNKKAIRLDNFIEESVFSDRKYISIREPGSFHAVFLGQFYANSELIQLISSLIPILDFHKKKLVIHYFGSGQPPVVAGCHFVSHGYVRRNELIRKISKWELALLPYPVEAGHEETARLSFPSKCRVYMAAGLSILSLAPKLSGVNTFLEKEYRPYYKNFVIDSDIEQFIASIVEKNFLEKQQQYVTARNIARLHFSELTELQPFEKLLGELF